MLLIKTLEKHYFDLISNQLSVPIYNHVPESATFPLIKIGRISIEPWVLTPQSKLVHINFEVFSNAGSNVECIEILENLEKAIFTEHNLQNEFHISNQVFEHGEVNQVNNDIWCASLAIKIYVVTKH